MKKVLALSVLVLALTGCSQNNENCDTAQSRDKEVFSSVLFPTPANPSPPKPAPAVPKFNPPPKITPPKVPNPAPPKPAQPKPKPPTNLPNQNGHNSSNNGPNIWFWMWWADEVADVDDIGECEKDA